MATSTASSSAREPAIPDADPLAIRSRLTPRVAVEFDAEWEFVLERAKHSKNLADIHSFLRKWQHFAYAESREPGTYFRLLAKAELIAQTGENPDAASMADVESLIRRRLGE